MKQAFNRSLKVATICALAVCLTAFADVEMNLTPVPYDWELRIPVLAKFSGDLATIALNYKRLKPVSPYVDEDWIATIEIKCPHQNTIRKDKFTLSDDEEEPDSLLISDSLLEAGTYQINANFDPKPVAKTQDNTAKPFGQWVAARFVTYDNTGRQLYWRVLTRPGAAQTQDSACTYESRGLIVDPVAEMLRKK